MAPPATPHQAPEKLAVTLYIAGGSPRSVAAHATVTQGLKAVGAAAFTFSIIDTFQTPEGLNAVGLLTVPALCSHLEGRLNWYGGHLDCLERVTAWLRSEAARDGSA